MDGYSYLTFDQRREIEELYGKVYLAKADMPNCVYPPDTPSLWQWEEVTGRETYICRRNGIKKLVWSTKKSDRVNHKNGCNMTVHRDYANMPPFFFRRKEEQKCTST